MKKWLIVIGLLFGIVGIACAEKLSRRYVALLQSNGHWEYVSVKDTDDEVWVRISNPKGGIFDQTWYVKPTTSGHTEQKVSDLKYEWKQTSQGADSSWEEQHYAYDFNYGNYALTGDCVFVWYRNSFSGIGFCFRILMPNEADDTFERNCVESFLNDWKKEIKNF